MLWFIYSLAMFFCAMRLLRSARPAYVIFFAAALYFLRLDTGWILIDEFAWRFIWFALGVYGAKQIIGLADWARAYPARGLALSGLLFASLGAVVFSHLVDIRGFELLMGVAGAGASITLVAVAASKNLAAPLTFVGKHSLYIFLSFFLPMAATRMMLVKLGMEDGNLITLIAMTVAVIAPVIAYRIVAGTPLDFFFKRPDMFRLTAPRGVKRKMVAAAGGH